MIFERRQLGGIRHVELCRAEMSYTQGEVPVTMVDLGRDGARFVMYNAEELAPSEYMGGHEYIIHTPYGDERLGGTTRWIRRSENTYEWGVEFLEPVEEKMTSLIKLMKEDL